MIRSGRVRIGSQIVDACRRKAVSERARRVAHASTSTKIRSPAEQVQSLLEAIDRPSYLASGFFPAPLRAHYLAIRAFNAEVARIADSVNNELMARIRIAWWRDAVRSTFQGKAPKNPTMLALADAIHDPVVQKYGGLVEDHFVSICDAREADLTAPSRPPTLEEVELYAEKTSSRLFYLSLNLLGVSVPAVDEAFSHLGKARGIAQMLSSMPFHAGVVQSNTPEKKPVEGEAPARRQPGTARPRQRRLVLPAEYLSAHSVVEEEVYRRGSEATGLKDAVFDTATRANDYIISARSILRTEFPNKLPAFLTGPMVETTTATTFLEGLQRADFDIFDTKLQLLASGRGWRLPWAMFKAGWFGPS